ncbi:SCO family protein [bacterium]|nr:MAG: SCO family protein [bacterium]
MRALDVRRAWIGTAALAAVVLVIAAEIVWLGVLHALHHTPLRPFTGRPIVPERAAPMLRLEDDRGRPFFYRPGASRAPAAFYFGYTHCRDACPLALARLARAHRALPSLRVIFVTIDPAHDDAPALHRYLARFDPAFVGLTGSQGDIAAAQRAFDLGASREGRGIAHDDAVIVADATGRLALRYRGADLDVAAFVDDLQRLSHR